MDETQLLCEAENFLPPHQIHNMYHYESFRHWYSLLLTNFQKLTSVFTQIRAVLTPRWYATNALQDGRWLHVDPFWSDVRLSIWKNRNGLWSIWLTTYSFELCRNRGLQHSTIFAICIYGISSINALLEMREILVRLYTVHQRLSTFFKNYSCLIIIFLIFSKVTLWRFVDEWIAMSL